MLVSIIIKTNEINKIIKINLIYVCDMTTSSFNLQFQKSIMFGA